jgi:DNA-binding LytR/AlgR family response regulator
METAKYSCLVVDDEPIARKILVNYIEQLSFLQLGAECINALSAIDHLRSSNKIDIIFLDINMPNLSGMQLVKIIQPHQPVIFTTAYAEYAVESYELNAVDYLLKPFSFERFTRAVYKALDSLPGSAKSVTPPAPDKAYDLFIKSDGKNYPVQLNDILYCEAMKNYTMVILKTGQKLMPLIPLSKFDLLLQKAGGDFIQVHRSYLISRNNITAVMANSIMIDKFEIPLGIQFKEKFYKAIGIKDGDIG